MWVAVRCHGIICAQFGAIVHAAVCQWSGGALWMATAAPGSCLSRYSFMFGGCSSRPRQAQHASTDGPLAAVLSGSWSQRQMYARTHACTRDCEAFGSELFYMICNAASCASSPPLPVGTSTKRAPQRPAAQPRRVAHCTSASLCTCVQFPAWNYYCTTAATPGVMCN